MHAFVRHINVKTFAHAQTSTNVGAGKCVSVYIDVHTHAKIAQALVMAEGEGLHDRGTVQPDHAAEGDEHVRRSHIEHAGIGVSMNAAALVKAGEGPFDAGRGNVDEHSVDETSARGSGFGGGGGFGGRDGFG